VIAPAPRTDRLAPTPRELLAEIAGILGRSEGAVRVLIHRALRTVARDLGGRR